MGSCLQALHMAAAKAWRLQACSACRKHESHLVVSPVEVQRRQAELILQRITQAAVLCHECILITPPVCAVEQNACG